MRAPPEQDTMTSGHALGERPLDAARVIFSPTTTPMLPPMKRVLHRGDHDGDAFESCRVPTIDRVVQPGLLDASPSADPGRAWCR